MPPRAPGFRPLLVTQALTAFHHNQLRSAALTMVAFGRLSQPGLSAESVAALATLLLVAPYVLLSLPAGRLADRWPRAIVIRWCKALEVLVALLGVAGLLLGNLLLLLLAILLAGMQAAALGPAKFAILPEMLAREHLVSGNSWVTASSTLSILLGLISGNLMALSDSGQLVLAVGGVGLSMAGLLLSLGIPVREPTGAVAALGGWRDSWRLLGEVARDRKLALAVVGCSWFWFQGVFNTTLMPLYVAGLPGQSEALVSLLLVVCTVGVATGALLARLLEAHFERRWVPVVVALSIGLPALDIGIADKGADAARLALDFGLLSVGTGLFSVPLGLVLQVLTPAAERARFIGINHLANGIAMMAAGAGVAVVGAMGSSPTGGVMGVGLVTGVIALLILLVTLPTLGRTTPILAEPVH